MKWFFSIIFLFFFSQPLLSNNIETNYKIKTKGITIGSLTWIVATENNLYETSIELKSEGIMSKLYSFEGRYVAKGKIKDSSLFSTKYYQFWKTKKKEKIVSIIYQNKKIKKMTLSPIEKEKPRIKYKKLENYNDPLTSFLNILLSNKTTYTIDGRRTYLLNPSQDEQKIKISIEGYTNIWADHKRNDLEYIEVFLENDQYFPKKINIFFKGSVFSLNKI